MFDKFNKNISSFIKQFPNIFSLINTKFIVYFGLAAYWSVMLLGTFIGIYRLTHFIDFDFVEA